MPLTTEEWNRLRPKIEDWMRYPNALGSEAQAAVIVGDVANSVGEQIPDEVAAALKKLALRGTMRDIAKAIQHGNELNPGVPSFHDVVDAGAAAAGLSWTEAITTITRYLDAKCPPVGPDGGDGDPSFELQPVPCPYAPRLMVVVLQIQVCGLRRDDQLGAAVMGALTPEDRQEVFGACEWFREHPDWDRVTYANQLAGEIFE